MGASLLAVAKSILLYGRNTTQGTFGPGHNNIFKNQEKKTQLKTQKY